ncbi:c-type cytochrome biogenesis protein CcmI [Halomonas urumqiensis]|uniref:C-type cytochrome biogenesis protein CcmI n=1 Tax=Halomonas urumqiensis TaxID=1684789 RepID=A0A2N7UP64_9GAMM|nr:c-type cytochrome biogenesis protein CcmI [Halomonas urumqiensis]PMR82235.1 c-type cytochrome biogenesis protein CcmI [Halomonas urumqiensis]PTB02987.1 c-type cytochrome biogenesis protein CcmI [Halomonas urumqiensis]GHE20895.1 c-type cytochrome biogenesis protein CcmI [Halomonas urumqiensis]
MTQLWIAFAVLLLPALWLLVAPLRRARSLRDAQRDFEANDRTAQQNVAIFRRRLASLEDAMAQGGIDQARFDESRLELERSLLEDTSALERAALKPSASGRLVVPLVMVGVVVASVLWYQHEGAEGDLTLLAVQREVANDPEGSTELMVERLEEQAARQPENPNVWQSLFPLYREMGRGEQAIGALQRLIEIEGRQPELLGQLAQIEFFVADREMTPRVQSLIDETLERDSSQPTVLGILGITAFDRGDYQAAIDNWRRAIAGMNDPASGDALRQGIQVAQQRLGLAPEESQQAQAEGPGIHLRVSLDDDLEGRLDDDVAVFVVARDIEGELPPLAVARLTLADLPTELVLDERYAMSPEASLADVDKARLVVRASSSGQATPQAGDLFGELSGISVGAVDGDPVEVVINRVFE